MGSAACTAVGCSPVKNFTCSGPAGTKYRTQSPLFVRQKNPAFHPTLRPLPAAGRRCAQPCPMLMPTHRRAWWQACCGACCLWRSPRCGSGAAMPAQLSSYEGRSVLTEEHGQGPAFATPDPPLTRNAPVQLHCRYEPWLQRWAQRWSHCSQAPRPLQQITLPPQHGRPSLWHSKLLLRRHKRASQRQQQQRRRQSR